MYNLFRFNKNNMKKIKSIRCERGMFKVFTSPLSCDGVDPRTKAPVVFFKAGFFGPLTVYTDNTKSAAIITCKSKRGKFGYATWDVFDSEKGDKLLGTMSWAIIKTALAFGAEKWSVVKPDGSSFLTLETMNSSIAKRILDDMTNLYNPTHQYVVNNAAGKSVASIMAKRGFWGGAYSDFILEDGASEDETKMALALFAGLVLLYKK